MRAEKGDYVLLSVNDKHQLAKIVADGQTMRGVIDNENAKSKSLRDVVDFAADEIIANFGRSPTAGTAYGKPIHPYRGSFVSEPWNIIEMYRKVGASELDRIKKGLKQVGGFLGEIGMTANLPITVEVRPNTSRVAGYYKHYSSPNKADILCLCPPEFDDLTSYYVSHETGHYIWYNYFDAELQSEWIFYHKKAVKLSRYSTSDVKALYDGFIASQSSVKAYSDGLDDDDTALFNMLIQYISRTYRITRNHLNTLALAGENMEDYGLDTSIIVPDHRVLVTEYGKKSPEELFAETFAMVFVNESVPKSASKLLTRTLNRASG